MLVCTHVIIHYICSTNALICSFIDISSSSVRDPKDPLSEILSSASIKATNEAVLAGSFETTEGVTVQISIPFGHEA